MAFGHGVEGGRGFVEHDDFGVFEDCAGYGYALAFAATETETAFADAGGVAIGELEDTVVDLSCSCGVEDFYPQVSAIGGGEVIPSSEASGFAYRILNMMVSLNKTVS